MLKLLFGDFNIGKKIFKQLDNITKLYLNNELLRVGIDYGIDIEKLICGIQNVCYQEGYFMMGANTKKYKTRTHCRYKNVSKWLASRKKK